MNLNKRQLDLVTQRFGIDHFGTKLDINYQHFATRWKHSPSAAQTSSRASWTACASSPKRGARGIRGLATIFRRMDSYDRNRQLDKQEFVEGLRDFGLR